MFCDKCGMQIEDNCKFCPKCGHRLEGRGHPNTQVAGNKHELGNKKKQPLLRVLMSLLIILIVGGGIFLFNRYKNEDGQPTEHSGGKILEADAGDLEEENVSLEELREEDEASVEELQEQETAENKYKQEKLKYALRFGGELNLLIGKIINDFVADEATVMSEPNVEEIYTKINSLFEGDKESILSFLGLYGEGFYRPPIVNSTDVFLNDVPYAYTLTREQLEYVAYSMTGREISFADLDAFKYGDGSVIGFGGHIGYIDYGRFVLTESEYKGNGIWFIEGDMIYGYTVEEDHETNLGKIILQLKENEDSCYGGFSINGVYSLELVPS